MISYNHVPNSAYAFIKEIATNNTDESTYSVVGTAYSQISIECVDQLSNIH